MKGYARISRLVLTVSVVVLPGQSMAWTDSNYTISEKYTADKYVFRPDARLDHKTYAQHEAPILTQDSSDKWRWSTHNSDDRVDYRPWGNYDFSRPKTKDYYLGGYQDQSFRRIDPRYRRLSYQSNYPEYSSYDYDQPYYQPLRRRLTVDRPLTRAYGMTDLNYAYNPILMDPLSLDDYADPYAYGFY